MALWFTRFTKGAGKHSTFPFSRNKGSRFFSSESTTTGKSGGAWNAYLRSVESRPILTKGITSGVITFTADIVCQLYQPTKAVSEEIERQNKEGIDAIQYQLKNIDLKRLGIFTTLGIFYIAPSLHFWYGYLMRAIKGVTMRATATRVFLDQSLFSPTFLAGLFAGGLLLEGKPEEIKDKLLIDLPPTVMMNWAVWIPSMIINFRFCPPHLQVLFSNSIGT